MAYPSSPDIAAAPAATGPVREGMMRVSILTELPALLREMGHDPAPLLREAGVGAGLLTNPEHTLPYRLVGTLMDLCVSRTGCAYFGLLLGQRGSLPTLGDVGLVVENSPDVGSAIRNLIKHLHHHDQGAVPTLSVDGRTAMLGYAIYEKGITAADQIYAGAIAIAYRIIQQLCGSEWRPSEVWLPFRKPLDAEPFKRFFRASLRFDAELSALVFPASCLELPLHSADHNLRYQVETRLARDESNGLVSRTRRALRATLARGEFSETDIARHLGVSRRTLIRQLRQDGASFQTLLREIRREVACLMLKDTDNSIDHIAAILGYAGASSFTRAFRVWTGRTPADWRNTHAAGQTPAP